MDYPFNHMFIGAGALLSSYQNQGCALKANFSASLNGRIMNGPSFTLTQNFQYDFFAVASYSYSYHKFINEIGKDTQRHIMSVRIGKRFLKNQLGVFISVEDALNRGFNYTYVTASNYVMQTWKPNFGRYYLLSIAYRFRGNNGKATRFNGQLFKHIQ